MVIQVDIKHGHDRVEVHLSGAAAAHVDTAGLQSFLNSRLNCAVLNKCRPKDSPETKAKCLSDLIQYKFGERPVDESGGAKGGNTAVIQIEGRLKDLATPDRVQRLVDSFLACRAANHCAPNQPLLERWNCVSTLAKGILQR
jgi:hypothetical protein